MKATNIFRDNFFDKESNCIDPVPTRKRKNSSDLMTPASLVTMQKKKKNTLKNLTEFLTLYLATKVQIRQTIIYLMKFEVIFLLFFIIIISNDTNNCQRQITFYIFYYTL